MEIMSKVGFFDEAFFMFYEDDDISIRVRNHGYNIILVDGLSGVSHKVGGSSLASPELNSLKFISSRWSYFYINKKYKGFIYSKCLASADLISSSFNFLLNKFKSKIWKVIDLSEVFNKQSELFSEVSSSEERALFAITEKNSILIEEILKNHNLEKDKLLQNIAKERESYTARQNEILDNLKSPQILVEENKSTIKASWKFIFNSRKF
jgi:GT2 family glycosyltransferase